MVPACAGRSAAVTAASTSGTTYAAFAPLRTTSRRLTSLVSGWFFVLSALISGTPKKYATDDYNADPNHRHGRNKVASCSPAWLAGVKRHCRPVRLDSGWCRHRGVAQKKEAAGVSTHPDGLNHLRLQLCCNRRVRDIGKRKVKVGRVRTQAQLPPHLSRAALLSKSARENETAADIRGECRRPNALACYANRCVLRSSG